MKQEEMLDLISGAYGDDEVKKLPEAQALLLANAQLLEKNGETQLVASRLCHELANFYLGHAQDFPKALVDLFNQLKPEAVKYEGVALSAMMTPLWFNGL